MFKLLKHTFVSLLSTTYYCFFFVSKDYNQLIRKYAPTYLCKQNRWMHEFIFFLHRRFNSIQRKMLFKCIRTKMRNYEFRSNL